MKATIEFNLDEPLDSQSLNRCLRATDYGLVIQQFHEYLIKNLEKDNPDDPKKIKEKFSLMLELHDVIAGEWIS